MSVDHQHETGVPQGSIEARVAALEAALVDKGLVTTDTIDAIVQAFEHDIGPHLGARVVMTMAAHERMTHYRITLTFSGRTWTIKDRDITAHSWADSVQTKRYAQFGRGFYLVRGTSTGPGLTCSGEALVKVG